MSRKKPLEYTCAVCCHGYSLLTFSREQAIARINKEHSHCAKIMHLMSNGEYFAVAIHPIYKATLAFHTRRYQSVFPPVLRSYELWHFSMDAAEAHILEVAEKFGYNVEGAWYDVPASLDDQMKSHPRSSLAGLRSRCIITDDLNDTTMEDTPERRAEVQALFDKECAASVRFGIVEGSLPTGAITFTGPAPTIRPIPHHAAPMYAIFDKPGTPFEFAVFYSKGDALKAWALWVNAEKGQS